MLALFTPLYYPRCTQILYNFPVFSQKLRLNYSSTSPSFLLFKNMHHIFNLYSSAISVILHKFSKISGNGTEISSASCLNTPRPNQFWHISQSNYFMSWFFCHVLTPFPFVTSANNCVNQLNALYLFIIIWIDGGMKHSITCKWLSLCAGSLSSSLVIAIHNESFFLRFISFDSDFLLCPLPFWFCPNMLTLSFLSQA